MKQSLDEVLMGPIEGWESIIDLPNAENHRILQRFSRLSIL